MIKNNTPHTPRKRGAEIASLENYTLALDLWRGVCAEAGLAFVVDNCTANGARKVAARYLDTGILTPEAVKQAMRKLARLITGDERARYYTLNALGNNVSRYLEAPTKAAQFPTTARAVWRWTCGKCGADSVGFVPVGVTPQPAPCLNSRWGRCDGTAYPKREG